MAVSRSLLYMFEFVIDDLMILKQNLCAPEEYPTCVELTFRSSVYLSVCDREFGTCVNPKQFKCGKCCIFALESPITDKDRLLIHVYKKKTNRCKFLIGMTELPMKSIFDRVKESFDVENTNWEKNLTDQLSSQPKLKGLNNTPLDNCSCYDPSSERREQLCPTTETTKRLLPLFNMCKQQTGNIVMTMHLICNGPSIVSMFSTNQTICSRNPKCPPPCCEPCPKPCPKPCKPKPCPSCPTCQPPPCCPEDPCAACDAGGAASATGGPMDTKRSCKGGFSPLPPCPQCVQPDPCLKTPVDNKKCLRYFACNLDKMCPTDYCEDEFDRECPTVPSQRPCKSVIEQKLETCGPCRGVPAFPRYVQAQKQQDMETDRKEKKAQDKEKSSKKKGRQQGGGLCGPDDDVICELSHHNQYGGGSADPCAHCCPAYANCCDLARNRAIRQLRHLLVKYNIQI